MNLVLSGPHDRDLEELVIESTRPRAVVPLHAHATRFEGISASSTAKAQIASACSEKLVDHAYVPHGIALSDYKVLAIDMDSTLISIECIDEIADVYGKKAEVSSITEAAMQGEFLDFSESLRRRVAFLKDAPLEILSKVFDERLVLSPGADRLIAAAKAHGVYTIIVSGGFTYFSDRLKSDLGIDLAVANQLEVADNVLLGRVADPIIDGNAKAHTVEAALKRLRAKSDQAIVIGDGANDLAMMQLTTTSIAYHGKPLTRKIANYTIDFGGLDVTLDYFPPDPEMRHSRAIG